ncbi:MAG: biotin--[acetyl-CoA-carboxylase] ligase [Pedosphaera sp.]|nr:biotin--[acetyl-CoA-carboxylase] ligase [Pedosphaera sp.]
MTPTAEILKALRLADRGSVSGGELATHLGVTRAAVWANIEELRSLGYEIEASPHEGYRLLHVPDVLLADDILSRLGKTRVIGRDIRVFQETTSTNDIVEKLARDGVKEGVAVFAETQTKGRGRLGRKWLSPGKKGLWFSVLLRPDLRSDEATQVTILAATGLARALRQHTGVAVEIKWPNDLLVNGRKVAGSLMELSAEVDRVRFIVLGIGLDVNMRESDFPPELRKVGTSLRLESGKSWHRGELAATILEELDHDYSRLRAGCFESIADEWEELCATIGKNVSIRMGERVIRGRAESLDSDGALILRTEHGRLERIIGGDVTLEK